MGLRELKKQQTRKAISDMATLLFMERGYHKVTTAEIAERAQVSVPTLFNYFPTKESLVFDDDSERELYLVNIVTERKKGQGILAALLEAGCTQIDALKEVEKKNFAKFIAFIENTPELNRYSKQMWGRHEKALAVVIRKEAKSKMSLIEAEVVARFVLDAYHRCMGTPQAKANLRAMFQILKNGWDQ